MTSHGVRATASTSPNRCGLWRADAIERPLAHVEGRAVHGAYGRGEHRDEPPQCEAEALTPQWRRRNEKACGLAVDC